MSCEEYREQLVSYVCRELERTECEQLEKHLEACDACRTTVVEFGTIEGLVQHLPAREFDEKLRIRDMLRQRAQARTYLLSKAALWVILVLGALSVASFLPVRWELSSGQLSVRWGRQVGRSQQDLASQLRRVQDQLTAMQRQNRAWQDASEVRIRQLLDQNNVEQQKRYFQTMQMFSDYAQLQRKADLQHIKHDIAVNYDRTGQEVERTNQMLEYVLRTSSPAGGAYAGD